ncbi:stalk domain-containing protein [Paenibacillus silviterrae]|uniref:stalk domain-containing protein n=1 Tax=Paenibacillus silviterrae TaxID=3242194 RepID=UPI002542E4CB|nr:stalk domain-containing protein [Paenibacillus chinjuensis]
MTQVWNRQYSGIVRLFLVFSLLLPLLGFAPEAEAEDTGGTPSPLPSVSISFDVYSDISQADLEAGGGLSLSNVSLDSAVYRGDSGKSVAIGGRTQTYNRLKIPHAFDGLSMQAGKHYNITMWAKVGAGSSVTNGYFFLSVVTYSGAKQPSDPPYYFDTNKYKFLVGQDGWTQLTLPYMATGDPVYGIAVEQIGSGSWTHTVPVFHIDDVEVAEVPPPTSKLITFDDAASVQKANIGVGGGQPAWDLTLDSTVVHGVYGGKSLHIAGRTQLYNRVKILNAFKGLDVTPGTQYQLSLYAKVDSASPMKAGYFYISVIDIGGTITNLAYYSDRANYRTLVTDQDWVQVTLPYTVGVDPIYGIAFEQMPLTGYTDVVEKLYIDDVEVVKTGVTTEIPPSRLPPKGMQIVVDGKTVVYLNGKPEVKEGVPFLQLTKTFSTLRADVTWDEMTQTATAVKDGRTSQITAGENQAQVNGTTVGLAAPAYLKDGVLMVPAQFVEDALEAMVSWDAEEKIVTIISKKVNVIRVDKSTVQQEIWGFGATANDPAYDFMNIDTATQQTLLDKFFGMEDGEAGLNIIRLEVNPFTKSDPDPRNAFQASIEPAPGVWDFDTDVHQRWFADQAILRNPAMKFAASVWSPPAWMKDNGSAIRGGRLKPEHYDDFAEYLLIWAKKYKEDYGYDVNWLSIQNEPEALMDYASAIYTGQELSSVYSAVYDAFKSDGVDVRLGAPEGGHLGSSSKLLQQMDPAVVQKLDYIGTHFYTWDTYDVYNYDLRHYNKPLFMMEYSMPDPNDPMMDGGLLVAEQINAALEQGYSSYLYWWYVSKPTAATSGVSRQSLVDLKLDGTFTINKRLYTMGQFSRFIRPGDHKVKVESGNSDVTVTAAKNITSNKEALVAANHSSEAVTVTIHGLTGTGIEVYRTSGTENIASIGSLTAGGGSLEYTLAPKSVTTFVEN